MIALLKATSRYEGWFEHSSAVIALVVMSTDRWNYYRKCSTSFSEHVETLNFATIDDEGTVRIGSSGMTVVEPGGGNSGAAIAWGVCIGLASVTREAGNREVWPRSCGSRGP